MTKSWNSSRPKTTCQHLHYGTEGERICAIIICPGAKTGFTQRQLQIYRPRPIHAYQNKNDLGRDNLCEPVQCSAVVSTDEL